MAASFLSFLHYHLLLDWRRSKKWPNVGNFLKGGQSEAPAALIKNTEDIHAEIMIFLVLVNDRESIKAKAIKCRSDNSFVSNSF